MHWLACALYEACRKSVTPTVGRGTMEGNGVSLTRLLRSAKFRWFILKTTTIPLFGLWEWAICYIDKLELTDWSKVFMLSFAVLYSFSTKWRSGQTWLVYHKNSLIKLTNWRGTSQFPQWFSRSLNQYFLIYSNIPQTVTKINKIEIKNKGNRISVVFYDHNFCHLCIQREQGQIKK